MSVQGKIFGPLIIITALFISALSASEMPVESKISTVTVYPDSAFITRTAAIEISPGAYVFSFDDILPQIDENSITVSARGTAEVKLYGARAEKKFTEEEPSEKISRLTTEIRFLRDEIATLQDRKKLLADKKRFLDSRTILIRSEEIRDMQLPSSTELAEMMEFLDASLTGYYSGMAQADLEIRRITEKIDVLNRELAQISGPQRKMKRSILVEIEALSAGRLDLSFSYMAAGASWRPSYDARASLDTNSVELVSYGNVRQRTGEDWNDVNIILSTARPSARGEMPPVSPWVLRPYEPPAAGRGALMMEKAPRSAVYSDAVSEAEPVYAEARERGTAINYELSRKSSIKSDGAEHKLPISSQTLNAEFEYSSYPARDAAAYLGGMVKNADNLQLLPGRVNIFMEGDFSGVSQIGSIAPGEEFRLALGLDENVRVSRQLVEKKVDETGFAGIPSRTRSTRLRYKITAENYKKNSINVKIFEPMPAAEDDRIKVNISDVSFEPSQKNWDDKKSVWLWEVEIAPGEEKELFYAITINHPRNMQVEGL